jgi:putative Holliday junction resolvase
MQATRALGVDFGDSRTGVAASDPFGWTAQGLEVVRGGMSAAAARVAELTREYKAGTIVVGYPLNMDGTAGFRAERTERFIAALAELVDSESPRVEIVKWDERLTTAEAGRLIGGGGGSGGGGPLNGGGGSRWGGGGSRGGSGSGGSRGSRDARSVRDARSARDTRSSRGTRGAGKTRAVREKGSLDIMSAAIILQSYLDNIKNKSDGARRELSNGGGADTI